MKRRILSRFMILSSFFLAFVALPVPPAVADDETDEVEVKVQATLDAAPDCEAMTMSLFGGLLTIDISQAGINVSADTANDNLTCADLALAVGQVVEVKLASDIPDPLTSLLSATEIDIGGGECQDSDCSVVKVVGPLQEVVVGPPSSVRVLGLLIDITGASLQGADDGDTEGNNQLVDVGQLFQGQFLELTLDPTQLPSLVATTLEVKNFTNQAVLVIVDENGKQVDDGDVADVQIDVAVTVMVTPPLVQPLSAQRRVATASASKPVKKVLTFHARSNGGVSLHGLPTGKAKIVVTRLHNGHKSSAKSSFVVQGNSATQLRLRLKKAR